MPKRPEPVLSNICPPSLLYTNQVLMFLHSTARSADILNPGNLAIIPQQINMMRLFLVHKLSIVNRDPDEIKAIYIQYARQSSVSTFKKEVVEFCRHLWQREIKQGLMYSNYSGLKVRNSIMKMLAPYPRKVYVKTLRVLMNDFEVREVIFRSKKSKTDVFPYCRVGLGTICRKTICRKLTQGQFAEFFSANCPFEFAEFCRDNLPNKGQL